MNVWSIRSMQYGGLGFVVGHEISHGFDVSGEILCYREGIYDIRILYTGNAIVCKQCMKNLNHVKLHPASSNIV